MEKAAKQYREFDAKRQYRARVEADRELIRSSRMVPTAVLKKFLDDENHSLESQMAVAVVLGLPSPPAEELDRVEILSSLIANPSERVRARAARAAQRWVERADASPEALDKLRVAVKTRLRKESRKSGAKGYLEKAYEILSAEHRGE